MSFQHAAVDYHQQQHTHWLLHSCHINEERLIYYHDYHKYHYPQYEICVMQDARRV